jgi:hypothetical protein
VRTASTAARICSESRLTGIVFFEYKHGKTGVAPNAIELQTFSTSRASPSVTTASPCFDSPLDG